MKTKKVTVWAAVISVAVVIIIIAVFVASAITERDEQKSMYIVTGEDTPSANISHNAGQTDDSLPMLSSSGNASQTDDSVPVSSSESISDNTGIPNADDDIFDIDLVEETWGRAASGEDVIAFCNTITEDMLNACNDYPSLESYWNDPIILLEDNGKYGALYGITANGQQAMLYYVGGEKIIIEHSFRNMYQALPQVNLKDIDNDGKMDVAISVITVTGSDIMRYGMIVCNQKDTWEVCIYDDYLKDMEEVIQWQYDEQENSVLFMNDGGIILTEIKLPEWTEERPFAGSVKFSNRYSFDSLLMQFHVQPDIELKSGLPLRPIEIVFDVNFKNGVFSLGSYEIRKTRWYESDTRETETVKYPIETGTDGIERIDISEYTGEIEGTNISEYIDKYVALTGDTEIERWEMLNHNGENILRIRVGYHQDDLRGTIQGHKEDYFIFINGDQESVLQVGYEDKDIGMACGYDAVFEDVTFDGNDDLLIWLGDFGPSRIYCAFIYENGQYRYEKSFENIPSYRVDTENHVISGMNRNSAVSHTYYTYEYQNGEFVEVEERTIDLEYQDGVYIENEYINGALISTKEVEYDGQFVSVEEME